MVSGGRADPKKEWNDIIKSAIPKRITSVLCRNSVKGLCGSSKVTGQTSGIAVSVSGEHRKAA